MVDLVGTDKRIFQGKESSALSLLDVIKARVAWWLMGSEKFRGISITDICRNWVLVDLVVTHMASRTYVLGGLQILAFSSLTLMGVICVRWGLQVMGV